MLPSTLFHDSGGLAYHLRALRHGHTLWRPYRRAVAAWLADWRPAASHLLLVGPSGGYSLTPAFLARFPRVTAVEPDPLARFILARRFAGLGLDWQAPGPGLLDAVLAHPDAAVLFCNLLGQDWRGTEGMEDRHGVLAGLPRALAGRPWASYHDIVSTAVPPRFAGPAEDASGDLETLLARFWPGGELPLVDHGTHALGAGRPGRYVVWALTPGSHHLVGWTQADGNL